VTVKIRKEFSVPEMWDIYKKTPTEDLRNRLVEQYLPLVKYNATESTPSCPTRWSWTT